MKKVLLIRHAESIANSGEASSDPRSIPLSQAGHRQSEELTKKILTCPDLIVLSRYLRTHQTAQPLLNVFPQARLEIWDNAHEFTYLDQSCCIGMNAAQRKPLIEEYWSRNDTNYCDGGNAETFLDFLMRAANCMNGIRSRKESEILLFSHGQLILAAIMLLERGSFPMSKIDQYNFMESFREQSRSRTPKNTEIIDVSEFF
ncbi:MAG: histidine phosphatase family protein [Candidatus Nomurabacteria bacterium]|jgi:broad specificity phosphatase PhoE|nr:histidine phosphatase family protein [Candidatus Nomurabacteria bacterium]